jgi:hypothetical protein
MAKINQGPMQRAPMWPWGGPRSVREKLVDRNQFKTIRKKGDPKNPALASAELLDFIGPAHSAEELRLPMPPPPPGHDADVESYTDRPHLSTAAERAREEFSSQLEMGLQSVRASPERLDRIRSLLARESQMLALVGEISEQMEDVLRRMREEQREEGF